MLNPGLMHARQAEPRPQPGCSNIHEEECLSQLRIDTWNSSIPEVEAGGLHSKALFKKKI